MRIWASLVELVIAHLAHRADGEEAPGARNARDIRELEEALTRAKLYAAVASACEHRLARELQRQCNRVAWCERRARQALAVGRDDLARQLCKLRRTHEGLLSDLRSHYEAAQRDHAAARIILYAITAQLTESRLVQRVLHEREARQEFRGRLGK